jgi:hypothetical protein
MAHFLQNSPEIYVIYSENFLPLITPDLNLISSILPSQYH